MKTLGELLKKLSIEFNGNSSANFLAFQKHVDDGDFDSAVAVMRAAQEYRYGEISETSWRKNPDCTNYKINELSNLFTGLCLIYYKSGQVLAQYHVIDTIKNGTWQEFDKEGNVIASCEYKNGNVVK